MSASLPFHRGELLLTVACDSSGVSTVREAHILVYTAHTNGNACYSTFVCTFNPLKLLNYATRLLFLPVITKHITNCNYLFTYDADYNAQLLCYFHCL